MKKLALVTPWPPQASGIADYAYELAGHLAGSNVEIHIYTNEPSPQPLEGVIFHHVYSGYAACTELADFDAILIQMGNHPYFHGYMLQILEHLKHKCIIELHDLMLHHLMQGDLGLSDGGEKYFSWLDANYGDAVKNLFQEFFLAGGDILKFPPILEFPCSDVISRNVYKTISHSNFVKSRLERRGCKNIYTVNLTADIPASDINSRKTESKDCFRIGVFGGVQRNRRIDWIIKALSPLVDKDIPEWQLDIIGSVDHDCEYLREMAVNLGIGERIKFHGRLPMDEFNAIISKTDLHIALRSPTMGETSAVVTRAMRLGIPSIVSNIGWYSELPDYVLKVDDNDAVKQLTSHVHLLIENPNIADELRRKTVKFSKEKLEIKTVADDILNIVFEQ